MTGRSPAVDAYLEGAPEHARPVLCELRNRVHEACPETEEALKWGMPTFNRHGIFASMAGFKAHSAFRFWKSQLLIDEGSGDLAGLTRITGLDDLPPRAELVGLIRRAVELNEQGVPAPRSTPSSPRPEAEVPDDLMAALRRNPQVLDAFEAFSPSARREYVEWITGAKREATRQKRLEQAIEWIAEGKQRNWKYM